MGARPATATPARQITPRAPREARVSRVRLFSSAERAACEIAERVDCIPLPSRAPPPSRHASLTAPSNSLLAVHALITSANKIPSGALRLSVFYSAMERATRDPPGQRLITPIVRCARRFSDPFVHLSEYIAADLASPSGVTRARARVSRGSRCRPLAPPPRLRARRVSPRGASVVPHARRLGAYPPLARPPPRPLRPPPPPHPPASPSRRGPAGAPGWSPPPTNRRCLASPSVGRRRRGTWRRGGG